MVFTRFIFLFLILSFFFACSEVGTGASGSGGETAVSEQRVNNNAEKKTAAPISRQAAVLDSLSKAALNKTKTDIAKGNLPVNPNMPKPASELELHAELQTNEPVAAATTPSKPNSIPAVKVNKENMEGQKPLPVNNNNQVKTESKEIGSVHEPKKNMPNKSSADTKNAKNKNPAPAKIAHTAFDALLKIYVSASGKVNYKGLKKEKDKLNVYLATLSENGISKGMSRHEQLAFWINAYNAFTIKLILDHYPVKSITDIANGKPWDMRWIAIKDKTYSLNDIENSILRPQFKEPRIHFAVNCAAKSCPPLMNRAWTASRLERDFEERTKAFVNNPAYNEIAADRIRLSKIFDWYSGDFGDLIGFLNKYSSVRIDREAKIEFLEYDWGLNE